MSTRHTISDQNPTYVTGADQYRVSFTAFLTPDHADFAGMEEKLVLPEHRRSEGYGLAFLESEEYSVTYVGTVQQIQDYRVANVGGTATLDVSLGRCYEFWPQGQGWDEVLPHNTWNFGGRGIMTEFDHRGAKVVVYEYLEDRDGEQVPMVAFHCPHCHNNDWQDRDENRGPGNRRWVAAKARQHIRVSECRPGDPRIAELVTAVANRKHGTNNPVITRDSRCATTGPCAQIRHLRATATR